MDPVSIDHAIIRSAHRTQGGQGLVEYALIITLIAIVAIVSLVFLGNQISGILGEIGNSV
jgi:Flp pilus assembly pilin Flp